MTRSVIKIFYISGRQQETFLHIPITDPERAVLRSIRSQPDPVLTTTKTTFVFTYPHGSTPFIWAFFLGPARNLPVSNRFTEPPTYSK